MKKFGRGFSLDFDALMNEVRQPPKGDAAGLDLAAEGSSTTTTKTYSRFNSHGSEDAFSPVDPPSTPSEDGGPSSAGGMPPTRMSVSRTGRCKNRSRQRLTVLQDEDFYRVGPPLPPPSSSKDETGANKAVKAPAAAASPKTSAASTEEAVDFDSALKALDTSIQAPVMANCYSF